MALADDSEDEEETLGQTDVSYDDHLFAERSRTLEEELLALADDSEDEEETLGQTDVSYDDHLFPERSRTLEEELMALADDSEDDEQTLEQTARITKRKRSGSIEGNASKKGKVM
jgi:hypothetical protein